MIAWVKAESEGGGNIEAFEVRKIYALEAHGQVAGMGAVEDGRNER